MIKILIVFTTILFVTSTCEALTRSFMNSQLTMNGNQLILNTTDSSVNFLALGDWGGAGYSLGSVSLARQTPSGSASAYGMGLIGAQYNTKFQLGLGDSFYFYGVRDANDKLFDTIFEKTYTASQLKNTPWFHTLGNHDYYGNVQGQIDYQSRSNRWILPNFNYTVDVITSNQKLISIVMIDTIKLCGNTVFNALNPNSPSDQVPRFASIKDQNLAALYLIDLENKLKNISSSRVPYIIVTGHFPVYSVADSGSTHCLVKNVMPLLHKYNVSAYLCGHDHNLQHISATNLGTTVEYVVSGANCLNTISVANMNTVPSGSLKFRWPTKNDYINGGFVMVQANSKNMTFNFITSSTNTIFGISIGKPQTSVLYKKVIFPRV